MAAKVAVEVRKSLRAQQDLRTHAEHCTADPRVLTAVGIRCGQQVRIRRDNDDYAVYTLAEVRNENADNVIRMGLTARRRLGTNETFDAEFSSGVVHPTMSVKRAEEQGEFIERLGKIHARTRLIALAPHGGDIEVHTDQQAQRVASRLADMPATYWFCKGYHPLGAENAWHITSVDIHPASFPLLYSAYIRKFSYAVAFHGLARDEILVGGAGPKALKAKIRSAIETAVVSASIPVRVTNPSDKFGGDDPRNIVNRLTTSGRKGIQIEQSLGARTEHWQAIADAVASVFQTLD